ncbi:hypothetical protein K493DRAFT_296598 [Basidiobolus meristosporus CBS 931.73]|uniref:GSKIP domain-containing protein n=1 Tax=Basidiobolus meristosporus CBS 931.73 TaxID=1314790 RepID=A0A1Y1WWL5_9FUNG|nr:hypothetical protein K493DRAFT_412417 [Basidiobolus meristosporus CBS 931.73]ORY05233.1 hypothetical protein K493DRAFT_296598 [Basidiobolus meristosporus CBS 931.73]|eukprot:ORX77947.1 hypothetical protein K493DRAFT_412417 [Basidiobolus meristosporus CBS 931.73]
MSPQTFLEEELLDATKNYTYGLAAEGTVVSKTGESAVMKFELLEKVELLIELSDRGFTIAAVRSLEDSPEGSDVEMKATVGTTFETMDSLLLTVSPAFGRRHSEELFRKLSVLR